MAVGTGSGKSKSFMFPFNERELEIQGVNLELARTQLQNVFKQQAFQQAQYDAYLGQADTQGALSQQSGEVSSASLDRLLQIAQGGGPSDEQKALLNQIEAQQISGIRQGTQENLQMLRQELAPQLGLRGSDSPILDRGGRVIRTGMEQEASARSQRAAAELSLPAQEASFLASLQNQDFMQRLGFGQQTSQGGLSLAGMGNAVSSSEFRPNIGNRQSNETFSFG